MNTDTLSTLLISRATLNGRTVDVLVEGNRFKTISEAPLVGAFDRTIDARGKILVPPFYNGHTHAAMNLLRGFADDMQLMDWLKPEYIGRLCVARAQEKQWDVVGDFISAADPKSVEQLMELAIAEGNFDAVDLVNPHL